MSQAIRNLILDMDGVLWRGETAMPGLAVFFQTLHRLNINYVLATNNATKTVAQYQGKLSRFGVHVDPHRILTSSLATADYLSSQYPAGTTVYIVGDEGIQNALAEKGFHLIELNDLPGLQVSAELVVVGLSRRACYPQLASAALLIRRGARFVCTNPDRTFPSELGELPGAGSFLAFLEAATGCEATIVGKPGGILFAAALERLQAPAAETAMVGDRLETDILGGRAAGLHTILLLSGVTSRRSLSESKIQPDFVLSDIAALTAYLESM